MPTGGIKIGSEINLGSIVGTELSNGAVTITKTTNTFTPTSRLELEQMFMEASEQPEIYKNAAGFAPPLVTTTMSGGRTYVNLDTKCWQGGSTTVVTPTSSIPAFMVGGNGELHQAPVVPERKVNRGGGRKPMKMEEEELSPEEIERRDQRRERNKQAAARCRKRRLDQTVTLQEEVDQWEDKKQALQEEIHALQAQKEELKFILDAHRNMCRRSRPQHIDMPQSEVAVKVEPVTVTEFMNGGLEDVDVVHSTTTATTSTVGKANRPISLNLGVKSNCVRSIEGIAIDTPTNVFTSLNFESLMEGRSGLTPTNILTPVSISFNGALNTPSCSTQQRNGYETPDTISPKLVSL